MKRRKCVAMLVFLWVIVVVTMIDMVEGAKTCLSADSERGLDLNLEIFIDTLNGYNGNCSCYLQKINVNTNVTITVGNVADMCKVGELSILDRNVCNQVKKSEPVWNISLTGSENVFLNVTDNRNQSVGGTINFKSQNTISLVCFPALETIPETTTPRITTTPITTTTTEGPIEGTLLATSFGVFGGFVILMIPVFLCVRYRERRREKHNAKKANAEQSVQAVVRENRDPEMLKYSWFKTLTIRIKRLYYGEPRRGRSRHRKRQPTGSQAGRRFRKLFASRKGSPSSTSTNSLSASPGPDNNGPEVLNEEDNDDVFDVVSPRQGGGIFMDQRSFNEELMNVPEEASTSVDVHYDSAEPIKEADEDNHLDVSDETVEGEYVNSLFSGVGEGTEPVSNNEYSKVQEEGSAENNNGLTETQKKYLVSDEQLNVVPDEVIQDKRTLTGILTNGYPSDHVSSDDVYTVPVKSPKKANGTSVFRM